MTAWGESTTSALTSPPRLTRAGVQGPLLGRQPAAVDLVPGGVLADRRDPGLVHALVLHPQRVDDVGLRQVVERVADLAAHRLHAARDQRRRAGEGHLGPHLLEGDYVSPPHA